MVDAVVVGPVTVEDFLWRLLVGLPPPPLLLLLPWGALPDLVWNSPTDRFGIDMVMWLILNCSMMLLSWLVS
jgi:hypothetical protein